MRTKCRYAKMRLMCSFSGVWKCKNFGAVTAVYERSAVCGNALILMCDGVVFIMVQVLFRKYVQTCCGENCNFSKYNREFTGVFLSHTGTVVSERYKHDVEVSGKT